MHAGGAGVSGEHDVRKRVDVWGRSRGVSIENLACLFEAQATGKRVNRRSFMLLGYECVRETPSPRHFPSP